MSRVQLRRDRLILFVVTNFHEFKSLFARPRTPTTTEVLSYRQVVEFFPPP